MKVIRHTLKGVVACDTKPRSRLTCAKAQANREHSSVINKFVRAWFLQKQASMVDSAQFTFMTVLLQCPVQYTK